MSHVRAGKRILRRRDQARQVASGTSACPGHTPFKLQIFKLDHGFTFFEIVGRLPHNFLKAIIGYVGPSNFDLEISRLGAHSRLGTEVDPR